MCLWQINKLELELELAAIFYVQKVRKTKLLLTLVVSCNFPSPKGVLLKMQLLYNYNHL